MALTGNQRRHLRGLAHHANAIVQVGHQGVTEGVLGQLKQALLDHELVKVRLAQAVEDRRGAASALAEGADADLVQLMGRTVVVYRPHPKKPIIVLPRPRGAATKMALASALPEDGDDESLAGEADAVVEGEIAAD